MLKLKNVKKNYGSFSLDCSFEVLPGRVTGLIGANGAGKSTSFKAVLGLIDIDGGEIELLGKPLDAVTPADKRKLGVVLSDSGFSEYMTVRDVTAVMRNMYPDFDGKDFLENCRKFGLPEKKKMKDFSTGMRAKLKVLLAMSHSAELLMLDEPTAGLDVVAREELLELLQDYLGKEEKRSVLISSHISSDLEKFCDDIYMIHEGHIILHEETDVLLDGYGVIKVDEAQYRELDPRWLLCQKKENFGYSVLTSQRQFYQENYPGVTVEKCSIDDVIVMMTRGGLL